MVKQHLVRNFCIIAHIDHGKSTLADRLLELTGTIPKAEMCEQVLDDMDLERERGITIKSHPISMTYRAGDGQEYCLNLIDTPGHVDFSYEVSRSLAACEGALLLVDASQGIEAQTLANYFLAKEGGLRVVPVVNKTDLPHARVEECRDALARLLSCSPEEVIAASAKLGRGTGEVLEAIVKRIPPPAGSAEAPFRAMVFDSHYDQFRGVVAYVRVVEGSLRPGMEIRVMSTGRSYLVTEVGAFGMRPVPRDEISVGEVGYLVAGIKSAREARVGDTISDASYEDLEPLPGFRQVKPMVFSGFYPAGETSYESLMEALDKLSLNDASLHFEPETSSTLGFGFRCGFLGSLHMEIVKERLEREFDLEIVATVPSVSFQVVTKKGEKKLIHNPSHLPGPGEVELILEPFVRAKVMTPERFLGDLMKLGQEKRGIFEKMDYLGEDRYTLEYELPLAEIVVDFYDKLKSLSRGYASLDYSLSGYKPSNMVRVDVRLNGEIVDPFSSIVHADKAYRWGREVSGRLKRIIPRQLFEVVIQASVGSRVISRETIPPLRKNVTAKCYGGDITRKRKLLEKQKEGKKRMKQLGKVSVPQEAFLAMFQTG